MTHIPPHVYTRSGDATYTSAELAAVLGPRATTSAVTVYRYIKPAQYAPGSFEVDILNRVARGVKALYQASIRRVPFNAENREAYFSACADTAFLSMDIVDEIVDDAEAAIALAILHCAGWNGTHLKPTTPEGQIAMKALVIQTAHAFRFQFWKQQGLV